MRLRRLGYVRLDLIKIQSRADNTLNDGENFKEFVRKSIYVINTLTQLARNSLHFLRVETNNSSVLPNS